MASKEEKAQNKTSHSDHNHRMREKRTKAPSRAESSSGGFTLIELTLVIILVALISTFAAARFDTILTWKVERDIRRFADLWGFLFSESFARGDSYRLIIDLDRQVYYVRREIPIDENTVTQVDYLSHFRTKGERERRARKEQEEVLSLDEEFEKEDKRQSMPLDQLYYQTLFNDPQAPQRLTLPLEFPSLGEEHELTTGLIFRDIVVNGEKTKEGQVYLRLSSQGASEFTVVHLEAEDLVFTVSIDPATGNVSVDNGDFDLKPSMRIGDENKD